MDASGLYFNTRKRTDNISETGSDIISNLPESILTHILSLLPAKYAVGTSVLSKQWKYMWTNIAKLHFEGILLLSHETTESFMSFMERVLAYLENNKLESFYLSYVPALHSFKWFPYRNDGCVIKMSGQNLKKFVYGGGLAEEIVMHYASSVVDVTIQVFGNQEHKSQVIRACNLLRLFLRVENLTISSEIFRALAYEKNLQAVLPTYNNLVRLKITWQRVVVDGTFMALLRSAPVLQTLIFGEVILLYKKKAVEEMIPECFFSHLKSIKPWTFLSGKMLALGGTSSVTHLKVYSLASSPSFLQSSWHQCIIKK
ncbi:F-box/LRR-repeat protein At1g48400-like [Actinidia eriantha]|uniref:F-box/LRR-repeat protein At1g48400-like n=1 Tax=Actinidia eriantha TaxID=165200 RepID=UPI002583E1C8|nr:F-box/LRR-repeat protein At1g48400-like [Actinidia eriantha]XP_057505593.1 F-box/LRR-repeat protein At1g48400-like [Actinidia eriantha]XP_057505594.1 F-box/LRR-repeat protein At1g48400-like [Actinidia eriantha]XP_057505595.1 F-box/LRR-repeat protein At1g48400-like [Actinidia eriantha]